MYSTYPFLLQPPFLPTQPPFNQPHFFFWGGSKVKQTGVDITCFFKMQNHLQQNIRKVFWKRLMEPVKHLSCSLLQKS